VRWGNTQLGKEWIQIVAQRQCEKFFFGGKLKSIVSLEEIPMQSDEVRQARVVTDFMMVARCYFGMAPAAQPMLRRGGPYGRLRPVFRSLLVVGSLGTALAQPVFALETMRSTGLDNATSNSTDGGKSPVWPAGVVALPKNLPMTDSFQEENKT